MQNQRINVTIRDERTPIQSVHLALARELGNEEQAAKARGNLAIIASFALLVIILITRPQGLFGGLRPIEEPVQL